MCWKCCSKTPSSSVQEGTRTGSLPTTRRSETCALFKPYPKELIGILDPLRDDVRKNRTVASALKMLQFTLLPEDFVLALEVIPAEQRSPAYVQECLFYFLRPMSSDSPSEICPSPRMERIYQNARIVSLLGYPNLKTRIPELYRQLIDITVYCIEMPIQRYSPDVPPLVHLVLQLCYNVLDI